MFDAIKRMFSAGEPDAAPAPEPHEAAAALLVEAALSDGVYANLESDQIAEILLESFDFDADKADAVLAQGEALAEDATGSHQFAKQVKALPSVERERLVEGLYRVVLADGEKAAIEEAFVRHVASLLHVDDVSRAHARKRAEARLFPGGPSD